MSFGERLRNLRKRKGLTQWRLGELLGVSESTISLYETGKREPDYTTLQKLADFFGVTVDYLLGRSDYPHLPEGAWPAGEMVKIPVLGVIRAGKPIYADEHLIGWELVPAEQVKGGKYFYLQVQGDSMIGARIHEGDLVLVRQQDQVENGEIAVVNISCYEATLKRVYYSEGKLILQSENPKYKPIIVDSSEVRIRGKVVKVEFKPL